MKKIIIILFIINSLLVSAQKKITTEESQKITGVITDNDGIAIPGVSVMIKPIAKKYLLILMVTTS